MDELAISIPEEQAAIVSCTGEEDPLLSMTVSERHTDESTLFHYCGRFLYFADYGKLAEHEIDRVFFYLASAADPLVPNPEEIADLRWESRASVRRKLAEDPEYFSAWFPKAFGLVDTGINRYLKE